MNKITAYSKQDYELTVNFCSNLFDVNNDLLVSYCNNEKVIVFISKTIEKLYLKEIFTYFKKNFDKNMFKIITISTGEINKNINNVFEIIKNAKDFKLNRNSIMIAIGGGILLDLVGFAATMYRRKISYIRVPTTLVGQIDVGVGFKTAINFNGSKNFIGSYYPPIATFNDIAFLQTLTKLDIQCGLAEIIKMAVVCDKELFFLLEKYGIDLIDYERSSNEVANEINVFAAQSMINQLEKDYFESKLARLTDFGHTFSPFIEEYSNYEIPHGYAVALDMALSTEISNILNIIDNNTKNRIINLLNILDLKIYDQKAFENINGLWNSLENIVLHRGNKLNLVVPSDIGTGMFIYDLQQINKSILQEAVYNLYACHTGGKLIEKSACL